LRRVKSQRRGADSALMCKACISTFNLEEKECQPFTCGILTLWRHREAKEFETFARVEHLACFTMLFLLVRSSAGQRGHLVGIEKGKSLPKWSWTGSETTRSSSSHRGS
jgi:hypothetical protein